MNWNDMLLAILAITALVAIGVWNHRHPHTSAGVELADRQTVVREYDMAFGYHLGAATVGAGLTAFGIAAERFDWIAPEAAEGVGLFVGIVIILPTVLLGFAAIPFVVVLLMRRQPRNRRLLLPTLLLLLFLVFFIDNQLVGGFPGFQAALLSILILYFLVGVWSSLDWFFKRRKTFKNS